MRNEVDVIDVLSAMPSGTWLSISEIRDRLVESPHGPPTNVATTYRIVGRLFERGLIERRWRTRDDRRPIREFRIVT